MMAIGLARRAWLGPRGWLGPRVAIAGTAVALPGHGSVTYCARNARAEGVSMR